MSDAPFPDPGPQPSSGKLALAERMDHLARLPLFADCPKRHLRHIARDVRQGYVDADEELISQGAPSRDAYVVVAGRAVVRRNGRKIAELGPGDIAGELGLLLDRPRSASVHSLTPVEYMAVDQAALRECVEESPELGWWLLQTVAARLSDKI